MPRRGAQGYDGFTPRPTYPKNTGTAVGEIAYMGIFHYGGEIFYGGENLDLENFSKIRLSENFRYRPNFQHNLCFGRSQIFKKYCQKLALQRTF